MKARFNTFLGATILFSQIAFGATTYYVSTTGNDSNSGDSTHPFRTVQKAVNRVQYGDTIRIGPGDYREQVFMPNGNWTTVNPSGDYVNKTDDSNHVGSATNPITIQADDPSNKPVIRAAALVSSGWTQLSYTSPTDVSIWNALTGHASTYTPTSSEMKIWWINWDVNTAGSSESAADDSIHLVMESETSPLRQVGWDYPTNPNDSFGNAFAGGGLTTMSAGTFKYAPRSGTYPSNHGRLYVWLSDNASPNGRNIEVPDPAHAPISTVTPGQGAFISYCPFVVFRNIRFRYSNGTRQGRYRDGSTGSLASGSINGVTSEGSVVALQNQSTLENCDVEWADYQGVSAPISDSIVGTRILNTGNQGVGIGGTNAVLANCIVSNANFRLFNDAKNMSAVRLLQMAAHNGGIAISSNQVLNSQSGGIHADEIIGDNSSGPEPIRIENNYISGCSVGIKLEKASYVDVFNNVIDNVYGGIGLEWGAYNRISHNTVVMPNVSGVQGAFDMGISYRFDLPAHVLANRCVGNVVTGNIFVQSGYQAVGHLFENYYSTTISSDCINVVTMPPNPFNNNEEVSITNPYYGNVFARNVLWHTTWPSIIQLNLSRATGIQGCAEPPYLSPRAGLDEYALWPDSALDPRTINKDGSSPTLDDVVAIAANGVSGNTGNIVADPKFMKDYVSGLTGAAQYQLRWDSPAIDISSDTFSFGSTDRRKKDFAEHTRGGSDLVSTSGLWDAGAWEAFDADSDTLPDSWETYFFGSTSQTATGDYDSDGIQNQYELLRGTAPNSSTSKNVTLYINYSIGLNSRDGLSPSVYSAKHGPKQTFAHVLSSNVSFDGDTIVAAGGTYTENVDLTSKSVLLDVTQTSGTVTLQ